MVTIALREVIASIKDAVAEQELSHDGLQKMVFEKTGVWISPSTISRLLSKDSEEKGFNYAKTLEPIQRALMSAMATDDANAAESNKLYEAALLYKETEIEDLTERIETIKTEHEAECDRFRKRIDELRKEYEDRIDYVRHQNDEYIKHLTDQIAIKDKRMDWKDNLIKELMEQVMTCSKCPVDKD